jgi:hypothetical protein
MVASSALVGCAGDATVGPDPGTPVVPANGGLVQNVGTSNETRGATENPQQVQVTVGGGSTTAWLPGGLNVAMGQQVAVFDPSVFILEGLTTTGGRADEPGTITVRRNGGAFYNAGVRVLSDGRFSSAWFLPDGFYEIFMKGPFAIRRGQSSLDIQSIVIRGEVRNGVASFPQTISGDLPVNGGSSYPLRLNVQMPATFANGFLELKVIHGNGILHQDRELNNGFAQFHDLTLSGNSIIPGTGVQTVEFTYNTTLVD